MACHLLATAEKLFHPKTPADTHCKDPISVKKLHQEYYAWSAHNIILGWSLNTSNQLLTLPPHRFDSVQEALYLINPKTPRTSICRCRHLLGVIQSNNPTVDGSRRVSTRLQYDLTYASGRHIPLPASVHEKLQNRRQLLSRLSSRPTHLRELLPHPPMWSGETGYSDTGMGGVFRNPTRTFSSGRKPSHPQLRPTSSPLTTPRAKYPQTTASCAPNFTSSLSSDPAYPPWTTPLRGLKTPPSWVGTNSAASAPPLLSGYCYEISPYSQDTSTSTSPSSTFRARTILWLTLILT